MKKLGARDFEDLLLCVAPVFEGLFDLSEDNKLVQKLLFKMAEWHAFAKLCMHTSESLARLESLTTKLGKIMRDFTKITCSQVETYELPRETAARARRKLAKEKLSGQGTTPSTGGRKRKSLNLNIYKWHALGDYVRSIKLFGPTDLYSTQLIRPCTQFYHKY